MAAGGGGGAAGRPGDMSRRHELEQRLRKLGEIGEIMRTMKNLALMETRKLARFIDVQDESVRLIEAAAADFLHCFPRPAEPADGAAALLLIGAERGFCGDFNDAVLRALDGSDEAGPILAVGGKLCARLAQHPRLAAQLDGPTVAEDVPKTLNRLLAEIGRLRQAHAGLTVLHHRSGTEGVCRKPLLPPFGAVAAPSPPPSHPPLLNLPPKQFYAGLLRHYLFAALHELFYTSLMAENQRRVQHLEGAVQRLEEKTETLARQSHTLRQEEITEEIEVILLSVEVP
ncbi:MAG: F0F1 ATP synthase subunit gamma [Candidatus Methylumidiphilus sp.]